MSAFLKAWKTKSNKINYSIIGSNGEKLYTCNQGFERNAGLEKNVRAVAEFFGQVMGKIEVRWVKSPRATTVIRTTTISI